MRTGTALRLGTAPAGPVLRGRSTVTSLVGSTVSSLRSFNPAGGLRALTVPTPPTYRVVTAGAEIRMLVLAAEPRGCVGVDLESGAFVRASHPPASELPGPFDVVAAQMAGATEPPDPARPEALDLAGPPRRVGSLQYRRAERLLGPLHHPPSLPLLGFHANVVPYWTLTGDRPSLALVELRSDARVRWGAYGPECHFAWQGAFHELLLADQRVLAALEAGMVRPSRGEVARLLGYRPRRLLVMLTAPVDGYCHKAVGALLPAGR